MQTYQVPYCYKAVVPESRYPKKPSDIMEYYLSKLLFSSTKWQYSISSRTYFVRLAGPALRARLANTCMAPWSFCGHAPVTFRTQSCIFRMSECQRLNKKPWVFTCSGSRWWKYILKKKEKTAVVLIKMIITLLFLMVLIGFVLISFRNLKS